MMDLIWFLIAIEAGVVAGLAFHVASQIMAGR